MSNRGNGERCTYCLRVMESKWSKGSLAKTKDHVEPECRGGSIVVWACRFCNGLKADLSPVQWARVMQLHPEWWRRDNRDAARGTIRKLKLFAYGKNNESEAERNIM